METKRLPPTAIEEHTRSVMHPPHRDMLGFHLGQLAEVPQPELLATSPESDIKRTDIHQQAERIADYFAQASAEAGTEATESSIWDSVFTMQLQELKESRGQENENEVATNLLVGNLLAAFGMPEDQAAHFLHDRMWQVALEGQGLAVVRAAHENIGVCVITGRSEQPYTSVVEQTQTHGALFMATDESVNMMTVSVPVEELLNASPQQQAQLIGMMGDKNNQNYTFVNRNLAFIPNKQALVEALIRQADLSVELLQHTDLGKSFTVETVLDTCFAIGANPTDCFDVKTFSPEQQDMAFKRILEEQPDELWRSLYQFTDLSHESFQTLIRDGYIQRYGSVTITAFKNLPPGTLPKLRQLGMSDYSICESLSNFELQDRKNFYKESINSFGGYILFQYPEQLDFMSKEEVLQAARESDNLSSVAAVAAKYTDGSDTSLLLELIDSGYGEEVSRQIGEMSKLDLEWYREVLSTRVDTKALLIACNFIDTIDQHALFEVILQSEDAESILKHNIKLLSRLDTRDVFSRLVAKGLFETVLTSVGYFDTYSMEELFNTIAQYPAGLEALADNLYLFDFVDRQEFIVKLVENGSFANIVAVADDAVEKGVSAEEIWAIIEHSPEALACTLSHLDGAFTRAIGSDRLFEANLQRGNYAEMVWVLYKIKNPELHTLFLQKCIEQRDEITIKFSLEELQLERSEVVTLLCESGFEKPLVLWQEDPFFTGVSADAQPKYEDLVRWGSHATVLCHLDRYPEANTDLHFSALMTDEATDLIGCVLRHSNTKSAPASVANYLLAHNDLQIISQKKELFDRSVFTVQFIEDYMAADGKNFVALYEYSGQSIDWLDRGFAKLGKEAPLNVYLALREIELESEEPLPAHFNEIGITARGQVGVEQLRRSYGALRQQLLYGSNTPEDLERFAMLAVHNPLAKAITQQLVRFTTAEWGQHSDQEWARIFESYQLAASDARPLPVSFVASEEYSVSSIDAKAFDPSKIDEDAASKFTSLRQNLDEALEIAQRPALHRYDSLFSAAKTVLDTEHSRLEQLRSRHMTSNNTKALQGIDKKLSDVAAVQNLSAKEFLRLSRDSFQTLTDLHLRQLDTIVRIGTFARAISKSPEAKSIAESLQGAQVTFDTLTAMNNFVEHIVNNEVYKDYFRSDTARKAFVHLSDTAALRNQMYKTQSAQASGRTSLQFVPSRGLFLELSGHAADACWASKFDSIAKVHPNVSAVAFVRSPNDANARIVGAGLLIETTDLTTGEEVVVLRGINPIENYINSVVVDEFFGALSNYVKKIAGSKRVAVVIDKGPGNAATNRPLLHSYLTEKVKGTYTTGEAFRPNKDSTFNGYDLSPAGYAAHPTFYLK